MNKGGRDEVAKKVLAKKVLFSSELFGIEEEMITVEYAITFAQVEKAIKGDTRAYTALMDNAYLPHTKEVINSLKTEMPILMNWTDNSIDVPKTSTNTQKDRDREKRLAKMQKAKEKENE